MSLFEKHQETLKKAVEAIHKRAFFAHFPEHPKAYGAEAPVKGKQDFDKALHKQFGELLQTGTNGHAIGEEISPYWNKELGVTYPKASVTNLIEQATIALKEWRTVNTADRTGLLIESLEQIKHRFHEIANATQHTTGQSYGMSFQAAGPHAADRALETIAMAYHELTRFPDKVDWTKPMGRITLQLAKTFTPIPKGIGLVIGCATFPTWNSVPGIYASLMTGNPVIVKPHPKSVLPIAIFIAEIQKVCKANGINPNVIQLAVDSSSDLIAKKLAEHPAVKLIDYTGSSVFGRYIESLPNKTVFTEKAGVNSVIIDSVQDLRAVMRNLAFSVSLYSGQMCTAPQNFFIPATGIKDVDGQIIPYETAVGLLKNEIASLVLHPKRGAGTLGTIQSEATIARAKNAKNLGGTMVLEAPIVKDKYNEEARIAAPSVIEVVAADKAIYEKELFGPIVLVIKTKDTAESIALAKQMALEHGAITCCAYTTDEAVANNIVTEMNEAFTPVSLNLVGFTFVNQHAAFSDFHVTGGNPSGNASFTDPNYVNRRFVWVGNRKSV